MIVLASDVTNPGGPGPLNMAVRLHEAMIQIVAKNRPCVFIHTYSNGINYECPGSFFVLATPDFSMQ